MKKVLIEIPDEFEKDLKDKFNDFFGRVKADLRNYPSCGKLCGNYEMETIDMLLKSFDSAKILSDMTNGERFLLENKNATIFKEEGKRVQVILDTTVDNHNPCAIFNKSWWNALSEIEHITNEHDRSEDMER